jgi:phosphotransferase system  glucose/maltose/N-acetylglucosamine-specific IIC component
LAVFLAFIAFNLDNKCDISFGFTKLQDVHVFLTIFVSFALGLLCTLPFVVRALMIRKDFETKAKKAEKKAEKAEQKAAKKPANDDVIRPGGPYGID